MWPTAGTGGGPAWAATPESRAGLPPRGTGGALTLEQELLLARYAVPPPARAKTLGRDPAAVEGHRFIG